MRFDTDVFIVGGGPAGLAAAIAARCKGLRVMLADGASPPIAKTCGEGSVSCWALPTATFWAVFLL